MLDVITLDTGLEITCMKWNKQGIVIVVTQSCTGTTLAIGGYKEKQGDKTVNQVQLYSPSGQHMRTMKVAGNKLRCLTWDATGTRMAIGVDSFLYFATIKPDYRWGFVSEIVLFITRFFSDTLVYVYHTPKKRDLSIAFWNVVSKEMQIKHVPSLTHLRACDQNCLLVYKQQSDLYYAPTADQPKEGVLTDSGNKDQWALVLVNCLGETVDMMKISITPVTVALTPNRVIVASHTHVYIWQFKPDVARDKVVVKEITFAIDSPPSLGIGIQADSADDAIVSISASLYCLMVARASGALLRFVLVPNAMLESKARLPGHAYQMYMNNNTTKLAVLDVNGVLCVYDIYNMVSPTGSGMLLNLTTIKYAGDSITKLDIERKDVWDMLWADDDADMMVTMEKTRMYTFRGVDPEEPISTYTHICRFYDLEIRGVDLNKLLSNPQDPKKEDALVFYETKSLRDARTLLRTVSLRDGHLYIADHPHPRLWRLLAEYSLDCESPDLNMAEKCFVKCRDYYGVQLVKRLRSIGDNSKIRAEVALHLNKIEQAEAIYKSIDRADLALDMYLRTGNLFKARSLLQGRTGDEANRKTEVAIGDYFADRQHWAEAAKAYETARQYTALSECLWMIEDYDGLRRLVDLLPESDKGLLELLGRKFMAVGECETSVKAFIKCSMPEAAVRACVELNKWSLAMDLAGKYKLSHVSAILTKYTQKLLSENKVVEAMSLCRTAGDHTRTAVLGYVQAEAAVKRLLDQQCNLAHMTTESPLLIIKKMFVFSALEMTSNSSALLNNSSQSVSVEAGLNKLLAEPTLTDQSLGMSPAAFSRYLVDPWRGAEAIHVLSLCTKFNNAGDFLSCYVCCKRLVTNTDMLGWRTPWSLAALSSYHAGLMLQCSRAFIALESSAARDNNNSMVSAYEDLAFTMFHTAAPKDKQVVKKKCHACQKLQLPWATECDACHVIYLLCMATGISMISGEPSVQCKLCKRYTQRSAAPAHCPLCHHAWAL